jgi:hypothetical protein
MTQPQDDPNTATGSNYSGRWAVHNRPAEPDVEPAAPPAGDRPWPEPGLSAGELAANVVMGHAAQLAGGVPTLSPDLARTVAMTAMGQATTAAITAAAEQQHREPAARRSAQTGVGFTEATEALRRAQPVVAAAARAATGYTAGRDAAEAARRAQADAWSASLTEDGRPAERVDILAERAGPRPQALAYARARATGDTEQAAAIMRQILGLEPGQEANVTTYHDQDIRATVTVYPDGSTLVMPDDRGHAVAPAYGRTPADLLSLPAALAAAGAAAMNAAGAVAEAIGASFAPAAQGAQHAAQSLGESVSQASPGRGCGTLSGEPCRCPSPAAPDRQ